MYSVRTVKNALRYFYRGAIHENGYARETADALLEKLDFKALSSVFRKDAQRVYAYEIRMKRPLPLEYRGKNLFGLRAAPLYENALSCVMGPLMFTHAHEVWLKEDGNIATVSRITVNYEQVGCETAFREICGYPFGCGLDLNLERLSDELRKRYGSVSKNAPSANIM